MAKVQHFEKLNNVERSLPFDKYFGEMNLSDEEIARRIAIAEDWDDVLMYILALYEIEDEQKMVSKSLLKNQLEAELLTATEKHFETDEYIQNYIHEISEKIIDATLDNIDNPYFTSEDRMRFIAENEANTVGNYIQYVEAKSKYTTKTWITEADNKVRATHDEIDRMTVGIDEVFDVGGYAMRFPKDTKYGASDKEIVNCRCSILYS